MDLGPYDDLVSYVRHFSERGVRVPFEGPEALELLADQGFLHGASIEVNDREVLLRDVTPSDVSGRWLLVDYDPSPLY